MDYRSSGRTSSSNYGYKSPKKQDDFLHVLLFYILPFIVFNGLLFFLLTNILEENSIVLCAGQKAKELLKQSNHLDEIPAEGLLVPGMVSRKKQFVPSIIATLQQ